MEELTDALDGMPVFWRRADGPRPTALHLHDCPDSSDAWVPFLRSHGGVAPDLPGFGRSGKPGHFPYTLDGYADWLERFCAHAGLGEVDLIVHGWGAVGLGWARHRPERVRRLVLLAPLPLLPGFEWRGLGRLWRRSGLGELAIGFGVRPVFRRALEHLHGGRLPREAVEGMYRHFDQGTQRAILRLHRAADPAVLAAAGHGLEALRGPALVACGELDNSVAPDWGRAYATRLPDAQLELVREAGHWSWLDNPELVGGVSRFLTG
jgi:pimeloyl-ACP methyl ester carboxylesterase